LIKLFGIIGIFLIGGIIFTVIGIIVNILFSPKKSNIQKDDTYECGMETEGPTWIQFKINYFLYAIIFVAFDIETVFLYPWAVVFKSMGLFVFTEMVIFVLILAIGLVYAWKEGALEWK
jgi:NADH:ubiquinone oxidoreductase subunit 3 (subunit A)